MIKVTFGKMILSYDLGLWFIEEVGEGLVISEAELESILRKYKDDNF